MPGTCHACDMRCFDPRPREGATIFGSCEYKLVMVSIRAPVRGRLVFGQQPPQRIGVSIRAPVRGRP